MKLRSFGEIAIILGNESLHNLGFDITRGEITAQQAVALNKAEEEMPSKSGVVKVDDIE